MHGRYGEGEGCVVRLRTAVCAGAKVQALSSRDAPGRGSLSLSAAGMFVGRDIDIGEADTDALFARGGDAGGVAAGAGGVRRALAAQLVREGGGKEGPWADLRMGRRRVQLTSSRVVSWPAALPCKVSVT